MVARLSVDKKGNIIKILSTNYINLTDPSKRGAHILLGEYLVAKYCLNENICILLPRLTHVDIKNLNNSDKKEWKILWDDTRVLTIEDLDGIGLELSKNVLSLKDESMKGGDEGRDRWDVLLSELIREINSGNISVKNRLVNLNPKTRQAKLSV